MNPSLETTPRRRSNWAYRVSRLFLADIATGVILLAVALIALLAGSC